MSNAERISTTRRVAAPASTIFALVSHPEGHVKIDGSGMLVAAPDAKPVSAVGDTFEMDMDREPLGDVPMGRYKVLNTVTNIEPDRLVEWSVGTADRRPLGHVYGYLLEPVNDYETDVTNYCDWSAISDKWKARITWPVVPLHMLKKSLANLDRLTAVT